MDCLALVQHALDAGLQLRIDAGRLVVRGRKRHAELARRLLNRKAEVIAAMQSAVEIDADYDADGEGQAIQGEAAHVAAQASETRDDGAYEAWIESIDDAGGTVLTSPAFDSLAIRIGAEELPACPVCGSLSLWRSAAGTWRCQKCAPPTRAAQLRDLAEKLRRRFPGAKVGIADGKD